MSGCGICNGTDLYPANDRSCCQRRKYYNASSNTCESCGANCTECVSISKCLSCEGNGVPTNDGACCLPGQYFNLTTNSCANCQIANCLICPSATICTKCNDTFYFNSTTSTCQQCGTGCSNCIYSTHCVKCSTGFRFVH